MRKLFALALIAILVSAAMLPEVQKRTSETFAKLKKTNVGKNILNAIQIEMSSKNQDNQVTNILALLNELLNEQSTQLVQAESDLAQKHEFCDSTRQSFESQIASKRGDIATAQANGPVLQAELEAHQNAQANEENNKANAEQALEEAHRLDELATAAYQKSQRNHNAMLEALRQARELIVQLQSSSFLQKNDSILLQLQKHQEGAKVLLQNHKGKALFNILMQMAQDVGIQADQGLVNSVVEVIDDLMRHESDSADAETNAENQRVDEHNRLVSDLESAIANASAEITRLQGEVSRVSNEINVNNNNIEQWTAQADELDALLAGHNQQCDVDVHNYEEQIHELNDQIEIIRQVIQIFEGNAIQDIKPLVESSEL